MIQREPQEPRCLLVAGTHSGAGKTTVALALMAALRQRGLTVQPFKVGPDFIDPGHHAAVCRRPCRNLDTWMLSDEYVRSIFQKASAAASTFRVELEPAVHQFRQCLSSSSARTIQLRVYGGRVVRRESTTGPPRVKWYRSWNSSLCKPSLWWKTSSK